jgi:hypothetical protein
MKSGIAVRCKVCMVLAVLLSMVWMSVARAEHHKRIVIFLDGTPLSV